MTATQTKKTLRFWVYANDSYVKLSLQEGESLRRSYGGPCEEGFSYTTESWKMVDGEIISEVYNSSSDCDGPHSYYNSSVWDGEETFIPETYDGDSDSYVPMDGCPPMPKWTGTGSRQRDIFAEMAGY